jgi:hypothetical protein
MAPTRQDSRLNLFRPGPVFNISPSASPLVEDAFAFHLHQPAIPRDTPFDNADGGWIDRVSLGEDG